MRLKVTKRTGDWHCCVEGDESVWGCGKTIAEAIGNLVWSHADWFGIDWLEIPK